MQQGSADDAPGGADDVLGGVGQDAGTSGVAGADVPVYPRLQ